MTSHIPEPLAEVFVYLPLDTDHLCPTSHFPRQLSGPGWSLWQADSGPRALILTPQPYRVFPKLKSMNEETKEQF